MQKKIKIDFDPHDKTQILHTLEQQQSYGYVLKAVGEISGIMTFESTYETMRYAVRKKKSYKDFMPDIEGWISKGDIGPYRIFSTNDSTIDDYPAEELSETEQKKKNTSHNLLLLLLYLLLGSFSIWIFISKFFSSTAALFEMQLSDVMEPICIVLSIFLVLHNLLKGNNNTKPIRNPSWFKLYVFPWICIPLILVLVCVGTYLFIKGEEPRSATEVPYQAPIDTAKEYHTLLGKIIYASNEFLYIAHSSETTWALYEEALNNPDSQDGHWYSPYFWNFNVYTELDTGAYENIDKAFLMDEDKDFYDLETKGILVLIDNRLYGIAFDKETTTAEIILNHLNLKKINE